MPTSREQHLEPPILLQTRFASVSVQPSPDGTIAAKLQRADFGGVGYLNIEVTLRQEAGVWHARTIHGYRKDYTGVLSDAAAQAIASEIEAVVRSDIASRPEEYDRQFLAASRRLAKERVIQLWDQIETKSVQLDEIKSSLAALQRDVDDILSVHDGLAAEAAEAKEIRSRVARR